MFRNKKLPISQFLVCGAKIFNSKTATLIPAHFEDGREIVAAYLLIDDYILFIEQMKTT